MLENKLTRQTLGAPLPHNPPHKHHYIPAFYLSRWAAAADGRLCQYSKPHKSVVPNRKHPEATGYLDRLYELDGLDGPVAQEIESKFFRPVDAGAADALALMEVMGNRAKWDSRRRSAWSRFLHSLLLRTPEDLQLFKRSWKNLLQDDPNGDWEKRYSEARQPHHPATFADFVASIPSESHGRSALATIVHMINNERIGQKMNELHWWVLDTDQTDYPLLTSDRPIIRTNGLMAADGHLALPIGPYKLFIAAKDQPTLRKILAANSRAIVREINRQVCQHAVTYVYGVDDKQINFVAKHFGRNRQTPLTASLVRKSLSEKST